MKYISYVIQEIVVSLEDTRMMNMKNYILFFTLHNHKNQLDTTTERMNRIYDSY